MKVEIVSTQTIQPAESPSPAAEKCFTLSIFDQLMPDLDIPMILFYSATGNQISASYTLKKSLSETLTHYFPLAGTITDNIRVDEGPGAGIEYTEARVRGELRDILSPPNMEAIGQLIPARVNPTDHQRPLLAVQQSVFDCGGMAVGICFSHKLIDAAAVCWFLKVWSATARAGGLDMAAAPYLSSASRFPPSDALAIPPSPFPELNKLTSRRFVLSCSQVASLKARSCSQSVPHPTRADAVISLIWQCAMRSYASSKSNNSPSSSSSGLWQYVNLRNRVDPPLPDSTFGNLVGSFRVSVEEEEEEEKADLPSLVSRIKHAKEKYMRDYPKQLDHAGCDRLLSVVSKSFNQMVIESVDENANTYFFSSVCKQDMYGAADFGWGKPIWATFYNYMDFSKFVVLSDTRDEQGIQVWLNLPKHQMDVFEKDPLFLSFATPNPNILMLDHHHQTTTPHRLFNGVATPWFHCPSRQLLSRSSGISQLLSPVRDHYSPRPPCIHSRTIPPPRSIQFISSLLQFHRKLK